MQLDLFTLLELGGPVAVLLIGLSVVALAMSVYKTVQFAIGRVGRHKTALNAMHKWFDGERDEAYELIINHRAPLSKVLAHAMRGLTHGGANIEAIKEDTTRVALEELRNIRKYIRGIELISQTAPLIGLFGTVVGMIQAFSELQASGAAVNPAALAGGIWIALLATALGPRGGHCFFTRGGLARFARRRRKIGHRNVHDRIFCASHHRGPGAQISAMSPWYRGGVRPMRIERPAGHLEAHSAGPTGRRRIFIAYVFHALDHLHALWPA